MTHRHTKFTLTLGGAFISSLTVATAVAAAEENPFAIRVLDQGYMVAGGMGTSGHGMGKMGMPEGKCGGGMMGMMDENKNKQVSRDEFIKHHEKMFDMMDKNKDGALDDSELGGGEGGGEGMQHGGGGDAKKSDGSCGGGMR
jgi:hypothetical protein